MENQENKNQETVETTTENTAATTDENKETQPTIEIKKADLLKRFLALFIDSIPAIIVAFVPVIGGLAAAVYLMVRDGLEVDFMYKRSIGKKIMKLKPVTSSGKDLTIQDSIKRNWPLALGYLTCALSPVLMFIPILGWGLLLLLGLAAMGLGIAECVLVLADDKGLRLGDKMASTVVIEVAE